MSERPIRPIRYWVVQHGRVERVDAHIVDETSLCLYVNGQEWVTLMCSPHALEDLVVGFLYLEGVIQGIEDIALLERTGSGTCVDVWLRRPVTALPRKAVITAGCGGGRTFEDMTSALPPVPDGPVYPPAAISRAMGQLQAAATAYRTARGIHTSALSDGERLLFVAEDVGRHNTIDRLCGQALRAGISPAGCLLLTTGRISSEMARKAAKMQVPVVASRTSPTALAVSLAEAWGIAVVGYVRRDSLRVYTHPERLGWVPDTSEVKAATP